MRVSVNIVRRNGNAGRTCGALARGIKRLGDTADLRSDREYDMSGYDACILWGYLTSCQAVVKSCKDHGIPFIFIDMGYWRRDLDFYKVSVNDRHPTDYVMKTDLPDDRFTKLGLEIKPWREPDPQAKIILAGMSGKAAWSFKLESESFERETVATLRWSTKRTIVYRPKPTWNEATSLPYTILSRGSTIEQVLNGAHCVVTHHSNVGCDALLEGVPVFTKQGAATPLSFQDITKVEAPYFPDNRKQWAANVAYCQWNLTEMSSGDCWSYLKESGLLKK